VLATASGRAVVLRNPRTGERIGEPILHTGGGDALAFSPDSHTLAIAGSGSEEIMLAALSGAKPTISMLRGHTSWIESLSFSSDGQTLASASADGSVILWRPFQTGRLAQSVRAESAVESLALSSDGELLAVGTCGSVEGGCRRGQVHLWRLDHTHPSGPPTIKPLGAPFGGHTGAVDTVAFGDGDRELVSASCADFAGSRCVGAQLLRWDTSGRAIGDATVLMNDVSNRRESVFR
jgi:WD40 repeat protein